MSETQSRSNNQKGESQADGGLSAKELASLEKEKDDLAQFFPVHLREEAKRSWIIIGEVAGMKVLKIKPEKLVYLEVTETKGESGFHEKVVPQGTYTLAEQTRHIFEFEDDF